MIVVPAAFAEATIRREGEAGRTWITALPALVASLCDRWSLVIDGTPMHGYLGLVVPVQRWGEQFVLKVSWLEASTVDEATALRAWNGDGMVRLIDADLSVGALLLERLDFTRRLSQVGIDEAIPIAGRLLRRQAIVAPPGLRTTHTMAQEIVDTLVERWERTGRPMPRPVLDLAANLALQLGATPGDRLVNYDLHYDDILAATRTPWIAVDPKVVQGDPEFGIAQLLWCRLEDIEAAGGLDHHFAVLVAAAELDSALARAWTLVRCVDYWLWGLGAGLTYDPARCERIVTWLVAQRSSTAA